LSDSRRRGTVRFLSAIAVATDGKLLMALERSVVSLNFVSWNQLDASLRQIDGLRRAS
jgi:hypothetical protein